MRVLDAGHTYVLDTLDGNVFQDLVFVKRFREEANHPGTTNQEVLRVLIDRVQVLDSEVPWEGNVQILSHLRMALVLHECRALERKVAKGELSPESIRTSAKDGHFLLKRRY